MKKRFNVNLNRESTERLQEILSSSGQSLSGFISGMIDEYVETMDTMKGLRNPPKSPADLTVGQAVKMFSGLLGKWASEAPKPKGTGRKKTS